MHERPDKAENTLYIGDLEEGITEEQLYVEFRKFGTIKYLKLHRYPFIGKSKHYAFISYSAKEEAEIARTTMNYRELLRHPIRVTKSQEFDRDANIFFSGFPSNASIKKVDEFFSKFGPVVSIKFSTDENKKSRGYGWVQFEKAEDVERLFQEALPNQSKVMFDEKTPILVKKFVKKFTQEREDRRNNLYVKNFWGSLDNYDLTKDTVKNELINEMETKLKEFFTEYGTIISVFVKIDVERSAPFAFVSFNLNSEAKNAQQALTNHKRDPFASGKTIYVTWAQRKVDRQQQRDNNMNGKYIYADYLNRDVTEQKIREVMRECGYGEIQMIRLDKLPGYPTTLIRIGYIVFEQASEA